MCNVSGVWMCRGWVREAVREKCPAFPVFLSFFLSFFFRTVLGRKERKFGWKVRKVKTKITQREIEAWF